MTTVNAGRVQRTTDDVISYTREVFYTTAAHQHDAVLLQVVSFTTDVGVHLLTVGHSYSRHLTHG